MFKLAKSRDTLNTVVTLTETKKVLEYRLCKI
jgi:hypothetical protein